MSLAEQSQQWCPTSVQVTVLQARSLRIKGKNGTNDAYAIMQVAREKFSTAVAEKSVAPVWKEEASFDLPLLQPGNAERCSLQVSVLHRALVGPDKLLGLATVNLLELYDNKSRNKSEWFKLMGKTGKPDKDRGEVLLDIQFMKNNMTASMYDLSGQDKSRSRLGKFKDKLKGKKKDGMSDSASAIVPPVGQILTDSEGEEEAEVTPGTKKKSKLKSLFAPKGLQRNMSQSMSTLATLPEKDSAISLSRSSGLNVESPEAKKKFRLFKHKRTGSSDSKVSQGASSFGQGTTQSNLCINGSHVYTEEPETRDSRTGSTFSLNSSGHGSMEDLRNRKISTTSVDSLKASDLQTQESAVEEMHRRQEEQRKQEEEVRKRLEEERRRQIEEEEREQLRRETMRREEERKRIEREEERKRIEREEEEKRRLEELEEERRRIEREEEKRRLEELKEEKRRIEREEEKRRLEELEEEKRRLEKLEEERRRIEREEEKRRLEKLEEERRRIEREEENRKLEKQEEEERRRIEREEEKRRLEEQEEERRRIEREEEKRRLEEQEEERRRIEREEEKRRLEKQEEERRRIEREEEKRRLEKQEEERRRIVREEEKRRLEKQEEERKEELARIKREQEKARQEEERKRAEEERMREEEEERIREERRKRMEEEERAKFEKERIKKEEEMRRTELERRRAEEEERLRKEKREAEEKRKRKEEEERRMTEEKEQKELERLRLEKERKELERKEKEEEKRIRRKEEEERKKKAEQECVRQEKEKEQINVIERPDVKPRSARMNTSKRAEKPDTIGSEYVPSTSPFEDDLLFDETSTNFFEQSSVLQPEALRSSAKVSAVKPSSSVSGNFFTQTSVPNSNPFLDDSDAVFGNIVSLGDGTERSEKKRRAPMPPQNKTQVGKPEVSPRTQVSESIQTHPGPDSEDSGQPDASSSRRDKQPAPLPPVVSKNRPHAVKPLSTTDNQPEFRENQDADAVQVKMKAPVPKAAPKGTGPYSQLTHEELVNLLEKQKDQLQKDAKIMELEQYIDNLLPVSWRRNPAS